MILAYEQWVVRVFGLTLSYSNFAYIVAQKKKKKEEESRNEEEEVGTDAIFSSIYFSQHPNIDLPTKKCTHTS